MNTISNVTFTICCAIAAPLLLANGAFAQDDDHDRGEQRAREQAIADISVAKDSTIEAIVASWEPLIESRGGSASQLESTLQHTDAETLLDISNASSLEEINELLKSN